MTEQLQPQHQLAATNLCEPRSQMLKDVYAAIVNDYDKSLRAVQKLLHDKRLTPLQRGTTLHRRHATFSFSYQCSWHRGTQSSSSALALLPSVFACVHVSVRSIVGLLSRVQPTHPTVSAFAMLARSVASAALLCSAVCAVPVSAVYTSHSFSLSRVHAHVAEDYKSKAVETRDNSI